VVIPNCQRARSKAFTQYLQHRTSTVCSSSTVRRRCPVREVFRISAERREY
jgi:hypothetical protein